MIKGNATDIEEYDHHQIYLQHRYIMKALKSD